VHDAVCKSSVHENTRAHAVHGMLCHAPVRVIDERTQTGGGTIQMGRASTVVADLARLSGEVSDMSVVGWVGCLLFANR
jgi:hypothetical protein